MSLLRIDEVSVSLGGQKILAEANLIIGPGEVVGLIGPNGAGKTTLMRAALGLIPFKGYSSLAELSDIARARAVAWMPQERHIAWPIEVQALIMLGRLPYRSYSLAPSAADQQAVRAAMEQVDLVGFATRRATELSVGERTRALIARALAQQTPLLMADEPIAGLDPAHQMSTMQTFVALAERGNAVLLSIHDLGLAARYCSRLILLGEQSVVADGAPADVLTAENLARIFGIEAYLKHTPQGLIFQPLRVLASHYSC